ncbi:hypothetical protein SDC9_27284 [bioreactor metagenome]|uniref:S-adenosyl-L-methionine-dependent methyltransferase n=1 Tax=bioreactor metagenome TaxID=1076179 RepID=A0A644UQQ9_9ZZZZ|nr:class I SAM-dependent methyltransferase [Desulfovibrio desulfuricans]MEA4991634.1 class I SAM-dependent methyltransferase [Desulfovibrio desulfuricans]UIA98850.1 class I SAM-dependent methyltransferase [Desulfovibrio desulfuricans]
MNAHHSQESFSWPKRYAELLPFERTAWLDMCARGCATSWAREGFSDGLAEHLVGSVGQSPEYATLHPLVAPCILLRARMFDRMLSELLMRSSQRQFVHIWTIGAGFDSRWARMGAMFPEVFFHEADTKRLVDLKTEMVGKSPLAASFGRVLRHAVNSWRDLAATMQDYPGPRIIVAEGLFDYLPEHEKRELLHALHGNNEETVLLLDALNMYGAAYDNRRPEWYTGDPTLQVHGLPGDPGAFFLEAGWALTRCHSIFAELPALLCRKYRVLRWIKRLPIPSAFAQKYQVYSLSSVHRFTNGDA